ncbi:MAG: hypothetical protein ACFHWZ_08250 [Phycisphaerales bacterium]
MTDWYDDDAFWREMDGLIEPSPETLEEEFAELAEIDDPQARAMSASRLFSRFSVLSDRRAAEMMAREVRAMRAVDRHVLAELLKLRYALGTRSSVSADLVGSWANSVMMDGAGYDTIELGRGLVDLLLRQGEIDRAIDVAQSLKGDLWGQIRRRCPVRDRSIDRRHGAARCGRGVCCGPDAVRNDEVCSRDGPSGAPGDRRRRGE